MENIPTKSQWKLDYERERRLKFVEINIFILSITVFIITLRLLIK